MWGEHEGMGWWMLFGSIWFVVFWGLVVWALVTVFGRGERTSVPRGGSPLDIARRRYAGGEIDREEFEEIKRNLSA